MGDTSDLEPGTPLLSVNEFEIVLSLAHAAGLEDKAEELREGLPESVEGLLAPNAHLGRSLRFELEDIEQVPNKGAEHPTLIWLTNAARLATGSRATELSDFVDGIISESKRGWVWRATPRSIAAGRISILALVELVVLISAIVAGLTYQRDAVSWILWLGLLSPLLLLRSESAERMGVNIATRMFGGGVDYALWLESGAVWIGGLLGATVGWALVPGDAAWWRYWTILVGFVVGRFLGDHVLVPGLLRLASSVISLCRHPFRTLVSVPENWRRLAMRIDLLCRPEVLPGYDQAAARILRLGHASYVPPQWDPVRSLRKLTGMAQVEDVEEFIGEEIPPVGWRVLLYGPPALILIAASAVPRISGKIALLFWSPVLLLDRSWRSGSEPAREAASLSRTPLGKVTAFAALVGLVVFAAKIALYNGVSSMKSAWTSIGADDPTPLAAFMNELVAPTSIPGWQLCSVAAAVIAICRYLVAGSLYVHHRDGRSELTAEHWSRGFFQVSGLLRTTLLVVVQISIFMILYAAIHKYGWPSVPPVLGLLPAN